MKLKQAWQRLTAIAILSSLLPLIFRVLHRNTTFPGEISYLHLSQAASPSNAYHLFVWLLPKNFVAASLIMIFLSVGFILLLFKFLENMPLTLEQRFYSSILLATSPGYLVFSGMLHQGLFVMLLVLLTFFIVQYTKHWYASVPLLILASLVDRISSLLILGILLAALWFWKRKEFLILSAIPLSSLFFLEFSLLPTSQTPLIVHLLSDLGGIGGISLFVAVLSLIGLVRKSSGPLWLGVGGAFLFFLLDVGSLVYANVLLSILAGLGLVLIIRRKWSDEVIYTLTLIVIFCGLLFSSVSYLDRVSALPPDDGLLKSLEWSADNQPGLVLSHESKSFWIHAGLNRPAFIDPTSSAFETQQEVAEQIFQATDIEEAISLLESHNITAIWIDPLMKKGQVWNEPREGLLALLSNERFKKAYAKNGVEIYELLEQ